ncbi:MAG: glycoside hydrolase, partial [Halobacteriales archaeon]|nr:glycoside hydrolase [Halobacteriales archaeon]
MHPAPWLALAFVTLALGGCLQGPAGVASTPPGPGDPGPARRAPDFTQDPVPAPQPSTQNVSQAQASPPAAPVTERWVAFDGAGAMLPLPADLPRFAIADTGFPGAEPNLGITRNGSVFVTAFNDAIVSRDGGTTWNVSVHFGALPRDQQQLDPVGTSDPMLWVDPVTSRVMVHQMFPALGCTTFLWTDDDGASWLQKPLACGTPGIDHQKVVTGPYAPTLAPAGALYPQATYFCYNKIASTDCATSFDGGLGFVLDQPVAVEARDGCGGINGHPAAAPDGTVYV